METALLHRRGQIRQSDGMVMTMKTKAAIRSNRWMKNGSRSPATLQDNQEQARVAAHLRSSRDVDARLPNARPQRKAEVFLAYRATRSGCQTNPSTIAIAPSCPRLYTSIRVV